MKKTILVFSGLIIALLLLFQISTYSIISGNLKMEFAITIIAVIFLIVGIYINKKSLQKPANASQSINHQKIKDLEITTREYEVLQAISEGLSNKEIANKLFLSESTIKTHVSNLLVKLNAKRRTQALQIAQKLQII
ncbi:response regulator transcription factor [Algibacter amylolyticus]|uniref:Response regulator transcription factor n=1 Tax=Algibacter amylolyticus TaxID=1608400 RepID=A0A5M7BL03_9FLAO|nr:response regulator transcription factor [Algibacter amylolyticus]KAA5827625.1 response regulator transcription factor [Algibacter amylolyticus]MBB5266838.1 DNA-binding NarL/FixJ family response regulator [Algibacter amylolyticus]TSJ81870.1 response regulator transcription factor [Algibacter amylolyticus]